MVHHKRIGGARQNADVRISDNGHAYGEVGTSGKRVGLVKFGSIANRPPVSEVPQGTLYFNTDAYCLEICDHIINQWIPVCSASGSTSYSSHLGSTDGTSDGVLVNPSFIVGRVSSPTSPGSPFFSNGWDNDTNRDLTDQDSLTWELNPGELITDLQEGTITLKFYDGNGVLVTSDTLLPDGTTSDQSSTSGYIDITGLVNLGSKIEGFLSLTIPSDVVLSGDSGYLKVVIEHDVNSTLYSQEIEFFKDNDGAPSIVTQDLSLYSAVPKQLSGVTFASLGVSGSELQFDLEAANMWRTTYRADLLRVVPDSYGIPAFIIAYDSTFVTKNGMSPPVAPFIYNEDFIYSQVYEITEDSIINPTPSGTYNTLRYELRDPFNNVVGVDFAPSTPILINTYPISSTDTLELFVDEDYRLIPNSDVGSLSSINGIGRASLLWDSSQSLAVSGGLQVINGALVYPSEDYSVASPGGNPDYSGLPGSLGDEVYIRRFRDSTGAGRSNGIMLLEGMTEADRLSGDILVDIRVVETHVPGNGIQGIGNLGTGWLSLNTSYNSGTFKGDTGDGCFVTTGGQSEPYFEFTLGGFSTAFASNEAIEVRITYKNPEALSKRITRIELTNWT